MTTKSLRQRTWELLNEAGTTPQELAPVLGVSEQWVRMFKAGRIKAPNVDVVQKLYEHLTSGPLFKD